MKILYALALATPLLAQTTLPGGVLPGPSPLFIQQTSTTGLVGFTTGQTARLNVFNLNAVPAANSTLPVGANCTVELQFFDRKGASVGQIVVPNFAPGAATSLDLPRASVTSETAVRAEIRGAVTINPAPTPVESPAQVGNCIVFTTLEIIDASGSTVALTSDTRPIGFPAPRLFFTQFTPGQR